MVSLKDEIGFEVRIAKEKVYDDGYYVNSFEFLLNGKNFLEPIILNKNKKIYADVEPLDYVARAIKEAVVKREFKFIDFIEPDIVINVMPEGCYENRMYENKCECNSKREDEDFVIIFHIDSNNFSNKTEGGYGYRNISTTLIVRKEELLKFANKLEEEYKN